MGAGVPGWVTKSSFVADTSMTLSPPEPAVKLPPVTTPVLLSMFPPVTCPGGTSLNLEPPFWRTFVTVNRILSRSCITAGVLLKLTRTEKVVDRGSASGAMMCVSRLMKVTLGPTKA